MLYTTLVETYHEFNGVRSSYGGKGNGDVRSDGIMTMKLISVDLHILVDVTYGYDLNISRRKML